MLILAPALHTGAEQMPSTRQLDRATTPGLKRQHRGVPIKRDGADMADGQHRKKCSQEEKKTVRSRQEACDHRESANLGRVLKSTRRVGA